MHVTINSNKLCIELNFWEKLWALQFNYTWQIPLDHIERVTTTALSSNWKTLIWKEVKLPGTFVPGVIKAGTYYTDQGREFWYVTDDKNYLILDLKNEFYQKVILTVEQNQLLAEQLNLER
ncbi:hypothetical protein [Trichocoleus sp. FACHB-262]|uniref:hypothetical protein n=1 Tax=Trichocoleus sp. FACHB-262 TaxID=2692869 RepID=UPI001683ED64|nr:hypothetical protein [Trichocoleus sp. FACHB-262]MBD2121412.1 hypothetical protein [Trichocoleus sp. FACHB-262]